MDLIPRITGRFEEGARLRQESADLLAPPIAAAATMIVAAFLHERKVLVCGNGGSASLAQYFASRMLNRYHLERPGLAAIALSADTATMTSIANDLDFSQVYSKQVQALGKPGDVLLVMSNSGNSTNVLNAVVAAHDHEMRVIAMSGGDGGKLVELLHNPDIHIGIPHENAARIQEMYLLALHCMCESVDCLLLGVE